MAAVITVARQQSEIQGRKTMGSLTLGTSYATGGLAITPQQLGLGVIDHLTIEPAPNGTTYLFDPATGYVQARNELGELPNSLDVSGSGYLAQWVASGPY